MGRLLIFCGAPLAFRLCIRFYHALFGIESTIFGDFPNPLLFRFSLKRGFCGLLLCSTVFLEPDRALLCAHPLSKLGIGQASRFLAALRRKLQQQFRPAFARSGLRRGSGGCPCTFRRTYIVLRVRKGRHRSRMGNKCLPCGGLRIHGGRKRLRIAWHNRHLLHAGFSALGSRRQWIRCRHPQRLGLGHGVGTRRGLHVGDLRLRGHSRGRGCLTRGRLLAHKAQALHHAVAIGQLRTTAAPQSLTGGRPRLLRKGWTRRERHGQGRSRKVRGRCYRPLASASRPHGKGPGSGRKSQAAEALGHARRVRRQSQEIN